LSGQRTSRLAGLRSVPQQPREYRAAVLPPSIHARLAAEASASHGWHRYVGDRGDVLAIDRFGASAPGSTLLHEYGFTVDNVCSRALALLKDGNTQ